MGRKPNACRYFERMIHEPSRDIMHYCVTSDDVCFYFETVRGKVPIHDAWRVEQMAGLLYLSDRIASGRVVEIFDLAPNIVELFDRSIAKWRRRYGAQA